MCWHIVKEEYVSILQFYFVVESEWFQPIYINFAHHLLYLVVFIVHVQFTVKVLETASLSRYMYCQSLYQGIQLFFFNPLTDSFIVSKRSGVIQKNSLVSSLLNTSLGAYDSMISKALCLLSLMTLGLMLAFALHHLLTDVLADIENVQFVIPSSLPNCCALTLRIASVRITFWAWEFFNHINRASSSKGPLAGWVAFTVESLSCHFSCLIDWFKQYFIWIAHSTLK